MTAKIVLDDEEHLAWQRVDDGETRSYWSAVDYCAELKLGDLTGWRLPTCAELRSLKRLLEKPGCTLCVRPERYWSIDEFEERPEGQAYAIGFDSGGGQTSYDKSLPLFVRAVRSLDPRELTELRLELSRAEAVDDDTVDHPATPGSAQKAASEKYESLMCAARAGDLDAVRALVESGCDLDAGDSIGGPIHYAAMNGHVAVVAFLIDKGVDIESRRSWGRWTPLHRAAAEGRLAVCQLLVKMGANVHAEASDTAKTPLFLAAEHGHPSVVALLLEHGARVSAREKVEGDLPLHAAAYGGICRRDDSDYCEVIELLMTNGSDVNDRDNWGLTPLHFATFATESKARVELLLDWGADPTIKCRKGETPVDLAKDADLQNLLKKPRKPGRSARQSERTSQIAAAAGQATCVICNGSGIVRRFFGLLRRECPACGARRQ